MDRHLIPRLYVTDALAARAQFPLPAAAAHYLQHVLRQKTGDALRLFNGRDGEWLGHLAHIGKKTVDIAITEQTRLPQAEPDLWLCCAVIRKAHFDYMIEKATELGVAVIQPLLTARTQIRAVNSERCRAIAIESAEQSERLTIPVIRPPLTLTDFIATPPADRAIIICAESGEALPLRQALDQTSKVPQAAIVTGPEGGFTPEEFTGLRALKSAVFARLGPRILRADTAAIAALSAWQTLCGDWSQKTEDRHQASENKG